MNELVHLFIYLFIIYHGKLFIYVTLANLHVHDACADVHVIVYL